MRLKDLGEFNLIDHIRQSAKTEADVLCGIGDDASVLALPAGHHLLTSTDMLIEGIHFRHEWTTPYDLGHKVVAVNLSDIAAMGGTPRFLYVGLACPGDTEVDDLTSFMEGVLAEAQDHDVCLVGGDTCRSPGPWIISVTIEGRTKNNKAIRRNAARPGDLIIVSGTIGDSALALQKLADGQTVGHELALRHHRPTARVKLGQELAERSLVNAMIDISDGLAADLEHILQESGTDAVINRSDIPRSETFIKFVTDAPGLEERTLFGGEDYELLFTIAPEMAAEVFALGEELNVSLACIGAIREGSGAVMLRDRTGREEPILVRGYDHFCHC